MRSSLRLLNAYPQSLMFHPGDFEGQIDLAIVTLVAYLAAVTWIERRAPAELRPHDAPGAFAGGVLTGIALMSLVIGILWAAGVFRPAGLGAAGTLWRGFVYMLAVAVREEILYRGLVYRLSAKLVGSWAGFLVSGLVFAAWHAINPGATLVGLLDDVLAGIWLAAAYAATRQLWLPIGLHLGWNFAQGSIFGTAVSGHDIGPSLIQGRLVGPAILTGGDFGPEASVVGLAVVFFAASFMLLRLTKSKLAEPPVVPHFEFSGV
ncbi:MAG TPA: CPBP family intramembrane glutamic endopeptidase [Candidatus Binataceae bacterium]|jgi:hypothetical protein